MNCLIQNRKERKMWSEEKKEYHRKWREKNREKLRERNNKYYKENREKIREKRLPWEKEYRLKNKDKLNESQKKWSEKNKNKLREKWHLFYNEKENREKYLQIRRLNFDPVKKNNYEIKRRKTDNKYKILCTLRNRMNCALRRKNLNKYYKSLELLGVKTLQEFMDYFEKYFKPGMNWNNHGEWHIDHIIPCASFDLTKKSEQKKCFHYTNLQPLWARENLQKGARLEWRKS